MVSSPQWPCQHASPHAGLRSVESLDLCDRLQLRLLSLVADPCLVIVQACNVLLLKLPRDVTGLVKLVAVRPHYLHAMYQVDCSSPSSG